MRRQNRKLGRWRGRDREQAKLLAEMPARDIARHCRFQVDAHAVLAAIIRSQGGTVRVNKRALVGGRPDDCITRHDDLETGEVVYRIQTLPANGGEA